MQSPFHSRSHMRIRKYLGKVIISVTSFGSSILFLNVIISHLIFSTRFGSHRNIIEKFTQDILRSLSSMLGWLSSLLQNVAPINRRSYRLDPDAFVFLATFDSFSFIERKKSIWGDRGV